MPNSYGSNRPISWKSPVVNAAALPTSGNQDGDARVDLSTDTIYIWNLATVSWLAVATPGAATAIDGLTSDVSASGPGVVSATVNSVGGSSAADINSATAAANAATSANTASTIIKRDAAGNARVSDPLDAQDIATKHYVDTAFNIAPINVLPTYTSDNFEAPGSFIGNNSDADQTNLLFVTGSTDTGTDANSTSNVALLAGNITAASPTGNAGNAFVIAGSINNPGSGTAGSAYLVGGYSSSGTAGDAQIISGQANLGQSGNIKLIIATGATKGTIQFQDGSEGTSGQVWTSTDTSGSGHWAPSSGGGTAGTQTMNNGGTINSTDTYLQLTAGTGGSYTNFAEALGGGDTTGFAGGAPIKLATAFTTSAAGTMVTATVDLNYVNNALTGNLTLSLYNASSGLPTTLIQTSSTILDASTLTSSSVTYMFVFSGISISDTTDYALVLDATGLSFGAAGQIAWTCNAGGDGITSYNIGGGWVSTGQKVNFTISSASTVTTSSGTAIASGSTIGQTLTIEMAGSGSVIIKNAANTRLKSNADLTLNPSDISQLAWNGSLWLQTGGSVNN